MCATIACLEARAFVCASV